MRSGKENAECFLFFAKNYRVGIVMAERVTMAVIARIHSDFKEKFGIPRQSGLVNELEAKIVFEPEYRSVHALSGMEGYSHVWLLWQFSENVERGWSPTVRPPRLGGNRRVGVFATRSPFRPNAIGLSSVRLLRVEKSEEFGPVLYVSGADLMDGTPILDIKPYIPLTDCHIEASGGYSEENADYHLSVHFPKHLLQRVEGEKRDALLAVLAEDPRPAYQNDSTRIYGMCFAEHEIKFRVEGKSLYVLDVVL